MEQQRLDIQKAFEKEQNEKKLKLEEGLTIY